LYNEKIRKKDDELKERERIGDEDNEGY